MKTDINGGYYMAMIEQLPTAERHDNRRSEGALAGVVFNAIAFEEHPSASYGDPTKPNVIYHPGDKDAPYRLLFFPGSSTNMQETAEHFTKLYGQYGSLYMVDYQKDGFDHESLKPEIVQSFDAHEGRDGKKETVILTQSMGGSVSNVLRRDPLYRDRIGKVAKDVEDSPLVHPADLRTTTRAASIVAARIPSNKVVETVNETVMRWAVRNGLPHSDIVDEQDAHWHGISTAMTPFKARKGQTKFINKILRQTLYPGALHDARESIGEKYVVSSQYDSVLDPKTAKERLVKLYGMHVLHIIEEERGQLDPGNHGGIYEFPRAIRGVLEGDYSEAYQNGISEIRVDTVVAEAEAVLEAHNSLMIGK